MPQLYLLIIIILAIHNIIFLHYNQPITDAAHRQSPAVIYYEKFSQDKCTQNTLHSDFNLYSCITWIEKSVIKIHISKECLVLDSFAKVYIPNHFLSHKSRTSLEMIKSHLENELEWQLNIYYYICHFFVQRINRWI